MGRAPEHNQVEYVIKHSREMRTRWKGVSKDGSDRIGKPGSIRCQCECPLWNPKVTCHDADVGMFVACVSSELWFYEKSIKCSLLYCKIDR